MSRPSDTAVYALFKQTLKAVRPARQYRVFVPGEHGTTGVWGGKKDQLAWRSRRGELGEIRSAEWRVHGHLPGSKPSLGLEREWKIILSPEYRADPFHDPHGSIYRSGDRYLSVALSCGTPDGHASCPMHGFVLGIDGWVRRDCISLLLPTRQAVIEKFGELVESMYSSEGGLWAPSIYFDEVRA